jgi:hypothetical protein
MAKFPVKDEGYPSEIRFTLVDETDSPLSTVVNLFFPAGALYADRVQYENVETGTAGMMVNGFEGSAFEQLADDGLLEQLGTETIKKFMPKVGQAVQDRTKVAPNPNTRALFKQVSLRSFQFNFKLIPTNAAETQAIKDIIKIFRLEMYPESIGGGEVKGTSLGYKFPNRFQIEMYYNNQLSTLAPKVAPCYVEAFSAAYNPTGQSLVQENGGEVAFLETDINITLTESRTLDREAIEKGF